ncbi:MAG: rhomboid family intramembrane serine protease [Planctomycetota bacterium]|nr:rhomboid family intramembrane serine protease [Planctomycetota bacterium]
MREEDGLPDLDLYLDHAHAHEGEFEQGFDAEFESASESPPLNDEEQFQQDLREVTPHAYFTWLFLGINAAIFAVLVLVYDVPAIAPGALDLLPWGANFAPYTTSGDWWRLFTCMFLHFGIIHIAFNMWILKEVGPLVERLVGNVGFLIIFLGSGLVASMASTWWNPGVVSAGASGAIFGVIGALLGVLILGHGTIPKESLSRLRKSVTTFIFYNIYIGLNSPGIDMAAHLGGLGVGVLCGMTMTRTEMLETEEGRVSRNFSATAICGLCVMWMLVLIPSSEGNAARTLIDFESVRVQTNSVYTAALDKMERREIDDETFAQIVEEQLLELNRTQQSLKELLEVDEAQAADVRRAEQYLSLRIEGWNSLVKGLRSGEEADFVLWQDRERELDRLQRGLR